MIIIKNTEGLVRIEGTLLYIWWERNLSHPLWKTEWDPCKWLKIKLLYNPVFPLPSIYSKNRTSVYERNICILILMPILVTVLICGTNYSIHQWMNEWGKCAVYTSHVWKRSKYQCLNMYTPGGFMLIERRQGYRNNYHTISHTTEIWKKLNSQKYRVE